MRLLVLVLLLLLLLPLLLLLLLRMLMLMLMLMPNSHSRAAVPSRASSHAAHLRPTRWRSLQGRAAALHPPPVLMPSGLPSHPLCLCVQLVC